MHAKEFRLKAFLTAVVLVAALPFAAAATGDPAAGAKIYEANCTACHGANRAGVPGTFPALVDVGKRLPPEQIKDRIRQGGGLMPPFSQLSAQEVDDLASFLQQ